MDTDLKKKKSLRVLCRVTLCKVMSVLCQTCVSTGTAKEPDGRDKPCSRAVAALGVCVTIICDGSERKLSKRYCRMCAKAA